MLLFVLNASSYCELTSTFNVLTWRFMPVCRSCRDCLFVEDPEFVSQDARYSQSPSGVEFITVVDVPLLEVFPLLRVVLLLA